MKVDLSNASSAELLLKVNLDWEEVSNIYQQTFKTLKKEFVLPGFRPGKVPDLIFKRQQEGKIKYDFSNEVIDKTTVDALKEKGITDYLDISLKGLEFDEGKPFEYSLSVEVDPKIELPDYKKGFGIVKHAYVINPEDVTAEIEALREAYAKVETVTGGAEKGHFIDCDLQELDKSGVPVIGRKLNQKLIKIGEGVFGEPGSANLLGVKAGDKVVIRLSGKDAEEIGYEVTVHKVESHKLPELTDDFIKENLKEVANFAELKVQIEKRIQDEWDKRAQSEFYASITDYLLANTTVDIAPSRLKHFLDAVIEDIKEKNHSQDVNEAQVREKYAEMGKREIRWFLIHREIIRTENLKLGKDDIEDRLNKIADQYAYRYQLSHEAVLNYYRNSENRKKVESDLLEEKVFDFLTQFIKEKKETIQTKSLRNQPAE